MISMPRIDDRRRMRPASFLESLVHNPRKLFLRRALFQIHLWAGIFLALYVFIIALTGAILVFEDEFTATTLPAVLHAYDPTQTAPVPEVMSAVLRTCPSCTVSNITTPSPSVPAYRLRGTDKDHHELNFVADPVTATIHAQPRNWVEWVHDLHVNLLLGEAHGVQVNGVGAIILFILAITGVVLWWPGLRHWSRGFDLSTYP